MLFSYYNYLIWRRLDKRSWFGPALMRSSEAVCFILEKGAFSLAMLNYKLGGRNLKWNNRYS